MKIECETFKERLAADPAFLDAECAAHAEDCVACAAFSERVRNAEWLIQEALRFDVGALKARSEPQATGFRFAGSRWAGLAAVLVAGLALWFGTARGPDQDSQLLVAEILEQRHEELGFGNLVAMLQFATMPAEMTEKNLRLFADEVMPRLRPLGETARETAAAGE